MGKQPVGSSEKMDLLSSFTSQVVSKAMTGLSKRHIAIASNLANAETPGYRRKEVVFEDSLKQAVRTKRGEFQSNQPASNDVELPMRVSNPSHISNYPVVNSLDDITPQVKEVEDVQYRNDGNSVDIEAEMAQLSKNTEHYIALANFDNRLNKNLKNVLSNSG